jgi:uncharacterized protein YbgA (DUF1722 family)/uncharacterized protein YbbK (DUF523 family)
MTQEAPTPPLRIGISSCLLGENVRFDGGHKRDEFLTGTLARFVEFVGVCPEVEVGMATPREAIRLIQGEDGIRLVGPRSGTDWTERMEIYSRRRVEEIAALDLDGYILKKDSPSCGMARVRVHGTAGAPSRNGTGLFAQALLSGCRRLPVEEEGRLHDPRLRENFIERVFAYRRLREFFATRFTTGGLVRFHTREKLFLLGHEPRAYQRLGRVVAGAKTAPRAVLKEQYQDEYMQAIATPASRGRQTNVLQHMAGYFKTLLDEADRHELGELIEAYRRGLLPLVVPITLLRHHVRVHEIAYLRDQIWLDPHPRELMLRNHA